MSTKFTTSVASDSLPEPLVVLLASATQSILHALIDQLAALGHDQVTAPQLILFGNLDCGATYAAQIAQRMKVSRQAISKTLRELQDRGLLRLENDLDQRNQRVVVMTDLGEAFARDARSAMSLVEARLSDQIGGRLALDLRRALEAGWGAAAMRKIGADQGQA